MEEESNVAHLVFDGRERMDFDPINKDFEAGSVDGAGGFDILAQLGGGLWNDGFCHCDRAWCGHSWCGRALCGPIGVGI